jgi:hypothetical protein
LWTKGGVHQARTRNGGRISSNRMPCASIWKKTAVDRAKYEVLRVAVADYRGILRTLDTLLFELNHPFKNREIIVPELRAFALRNFTSYTRHPQGPQAIAVIIDVFLDAVMNSSREKAGSSWLCFFCFAISISIDQLLDQSAIEDK